MLKSNIKLLIYDLLHLIDKNNYESCEKIESKLSTGGLVSYLLKKYKMPSFLKTDTQEISELLKEMAGCNETVYNNGLIYLIEILLECC